MSVFGRLYKLKTQVGLEVTLQLFCQMILIIRIRNLGGHWVFVSKWEDQITLVVLTRLKNVKELGAPDGRLVRKLAILSSLVKRY